MSTPNAPAIAIGPSHYAELSGPQTGASIATLTNGGVVTVSEIDVTDHVYGIGLEWHVEGQIYDSSGKRLSSFRVDTTHSQ